MGSRLCFLWQIYEPMSQFFRNGLGQCCCLSVVSGVGGLCRKLRCLVSCRTAPGAVTKARSVVWAKTRTASHGGAAYMAPLILVICPTVLLLISIGYNPARKVCRGFGGRAHP